MELGIRNLELGACVATQFQIPNSQFLFSLSFTADCLNCHFMSELQTIKELQLRVALYEDMKAYHALYDLFFHRLKSFCFSFVKSGEVAEEIVSDVFIKLWQIKNKLPEIDNLKVYLYTIAKNFSLNYIIRNFKNPVVSLDSIDIEPIVSVGNPEELCISSDLVSKIKQTIQLLPPQCRIIFQLVKEDGLKYAEVAGILGISVLTVRNQVAIAIRKMAETLPAYVKQSEVRGPKV
jgi:RNA polymerase sigma-70 factor (family 1)